MHPAYLKDKAIQMRIERHLSIDEIAARLAWRCEHGVLDVRTGDTMFRARLQGWMDWLKESWV